MYRAVFCFLEGLSIITSNVEGFSVYSLLLMYKLTPKWANGVCHQYIICERAAYILEEKSMNPIMVSKIWVGMSINYINLLQFKIQSHLQKSGTCDKNHQTRFKIVHFSSNNAKSQVPVCYWYLQTTQLGRLQKFIIIILLGETHQNFTMALEH